MSTAAFVAARIPPRSCVVPESPSVLHPEPKNRARVMIGLIVLLVLLGGLLAIQSQAIQILVVISESMEPTLQIGDRILVDRGGFADRFSVVVLQDPEKSDEPQEQLVKRIVGVAGDSVEIRGGILYLNGKEQYSSHVTTNRVNWRDLKIKVPDDHVFVMGDNRNNSYDSLNFGPVEDKYIRGVLSLVLWPPQRWGHVPNFVQQSVN